jgi:uncharacterized protein (DUF433 family)
MAKTETTHVGVGLYSIAEASRILREHHSRLYRWTNPETGLVPRRFDPDERTITFVELMELHFIKLFRDEGVSLQTIRKASLAASKKFKTLYPFCIKRFDTDGKTIFATLVRKESDAEVIEDLERAQLVFPKVMKPFFHKLEYGKTVEPMRFWPREKAGRIVLDPARRFGKPIDAESGIPTRTIYEALSAGCGQDEATVAKWLGIPVAAVRAAAAYERDLAA